MKNIAPFHQNNGILIRCAVVLLLIFMMKPRFHGKAAGTRNGWRSGSYSLFPILISVRYRAQGRMLTQASLKLRMPGRG